MDETRILRVCEMEERLNRLLAWLSDKNAYTAGIKEDVRILGEYSDSGRWLEDFEADEAGMLPADLPRGVLSEDALYNALTAYEERTGESQSSCEC